ncbi:MAG: hypothetical protein HPY55_09180 [Firmicutes bacterium]|nr:hypothetical protein [Bacillota bacterium]
MRTVASAFILGLVAVVLIGIVSEMPRFGGRSNPALGTTYPRYTGSAIGDTGAQNLVTAIVLDYRGFDTLGETTVLFTAILAATLALAAAKRKTGDPGE